MRIHCEAPEPPTDAMPQVPYRPDAQAKRYASSEQALLEAGGRRVNVRIQPKAAKALDRLMKRRDMNQTEAINFALEQAK